MILMFFVQLIRAVLKGQFILSLIDRPEMHEFFCRF